MWPTPLVTGNYNRKGLSPSSGDGLATVVRMFPTPRAKSATGGAVGLDHGNTAKRAMGDAPELRGGQLNPMWVEWLMGWPAGWTDCTPLGMGRFRQWLRSHGAPSLEGQG